MAEELEDRYESDDDRRDVRAGSSAHLCARPEDESGAGWAGARDWQDAPIWRCPVCQRWWGYAWPGTGGRKEDMAWLPMRDMFTGHRPEEFADLIEAEQKRGCD